MNFKFNVDGVYKVLLWTDENGNYDIRCRNDVDVRKSKGRYHFETIAENTVLYTGNGNRRIYHVVFTGKSSDAKKVRISMEMILEGAGSVRNRLSVEEEAVS